LVAVSNFIKLLDGFYKYKAMSHTEPQTPMP
jgi:hypothetical protein